ncbi:hypothetical protein DITRI_Ditri04bG0035800 [Diplodiscus trichospermus]
MDHDRVWAVRPLMVQVESLDETRPERVGAKRLTEVALGAVKGGSSDKDLESLVKAVNELKPKKGSNVL